MPDHRVAQRLALQARLHQVDAPARRVHLLAPQHVGRAGGQAEAAVHAVADQLGGGGWWSSNAGPPGSGCGTGGPLAASVRRAAPVSPSDPSHEAAGREPVRPGRAASLTRRISVEPGHRPPQVDAVQRTGPGAVSTTTLPAVRRRARPAGRRRPRPPRPGRCRRAARRAAPQPRCRGRATGSAVPVAGARARPPAASRAREIRRGELAARRRRRAERVAAPPGRRAVLGGRLRRAAWRRSPHACRDAGRGALEQHRDGRWPALGRRRRSRPRSARPARRAPRAAAPATPPGSSRGRRDAPGRSAAAGAAGRRPR